MNERTKTLLILALGTALCGCGSDDGGGADDAADTGSTGMSADDDGSGGATTPVTTDPTTGVTSLPPPDTGDDTSGDTGDTGEPAGYDFDEIVASLEFLHGALDDDLTGAGLVPCAVKTCVDQAAPLVVPDVIHIDPTADPGFPNGRLPADPVIDVTLAVVLLDLSAGGQTAATLAGLPLNPPENDVPFLDDFPYLADPH